jgi:hypothetical protein
LAISIRNGIIEHHHHQAKKPSQAKVAKPKPKAKGMSSITHHRHLFNYEYLINILVVPVQQF